MGKILLINKGWSDNIGDQAIKYSLEKLIESHGHTCEFADLTKPESVNKNLSDAPRQKPGFLKRMIPFIPDSLGQVAWLLRYWPIFKKNFRKNDYELVIIGGGQLILNNASFPLAVFLWVHLLKAIHKNKVVIYGVGSSTSLTKLDKMLYNASLNMADAVYLRDSTSARYVDEQFGIKTGYTPDVVFNISSYIKEESGHGNSILISPPSFEVYCKYRKNDAGWMNSEAYEAYWENEVIESIGDGNVVKLFYTAEQDAEQAEKLRHSMAKKYGMQVELLRICDINGYIRELSGAAKVISGRMHALIIAYSFKKPVKVFPLSNKLVTFENEYLKQSNNLDSIQTSIESTFSEMIACHIS